MWGGPAYLPFFKDFVASGRAIRHHVEAYCVEVVMSPESLESFLALAIGFAFAGMISTGYQLLTEQLPSFSLLEQGPRPAAFAAVPLLAFAAPFIIMRNTIRGRRIENRRFEFVMVATVIAGLWSLMSGTVVVMAMEAVTRLIA
jgi:hypothetical protein